MPVGGYPDQIVVALTTGHMTGFVPDDFYSLLHLSIWLIPGGPDESFEATTIIMAAGSGTIDGVGEAYNTHDSSPGHDYILTDLLEDHHYMLDITAQNPGMSAGDMVGVSLASTNIGNEDIHLIGMRMKYRRKYPLMAGLSALAEDFWPCQKAPP